MDRYQELAAFFAVVETGGFSAAARRMGDAQSTVSKSVGSLEKRLGVQLLNRSTRSVTLTDQGRKYYERMKPLLEEMAQADGEIANSTLGISGLVRIAASSTFGRLHVLPLIPGLLALHPQLELDVHLSDSVWDLLAEGVDLAIRVSPVQNPNAVVRKVASTSLVCAGSRQYFDRHGIPETPEDLVKHNCLIFNGMSTWSFVGPEGPLHVAVRGNLSSNTAETILSAVRDGVGIGMFYRASLVGELDHPDIVTVLDAFVAETRDVSLIWPNRRFIPARVREVTAFFATALAERMRLCE